MLTVTSSRCLGRDLDERWDQRKDELEEVYRHVDVCGECVGWRAGVIRLAAYERKPSVRSGLSLGNRLALRLLRRVGV